MQFIKTKISGLYIIQPRVFDDRRGYFFESFNQREFDAVIPGVRFVQDNESKSTRGVIRGLHFQAPPFAQAKLVRCVCGRVLDVALDIRKSSPTYGRHIAVELSEENKIQFFIPEGFAHAFAVLSDSAIFQYKCSDFYHPEAEGGISIDDRSLNIDWLIKPENAILSDKDKRNPAFSDFKTPFE